MQFKFLVKFFAVALTLVCAFYLSLSGVTKYYEGEADKIAAEKGETARKLYLDSLKNSTEKIWLFCDYKTCAQTQIGLGLDLKGGMNVVLEVSAPDVIKVLADQKTDPDFLKAIAEADKQYKDGQGDFVSLFVKSYKQIKPEGNLAELFATQRLKGQVSTKSTDKEVEEVLQAELAAAVDNAQNVLRTRIDNLGVAQPNIQKLQGNFAGRIMVEMPGVNDPDRARNLLAGSANLEFWETYSTQEVAPYLVELNAKLAQLAAADEPETSDSTAVAVEDVAEVKAEVAEGKKAADIAKAIAQEENGTQASTQVSEAEKAEMLKRNPLLAVMEMPRGNYGAVVGFVMSTDTAIVNKAINSAAAKEILPSDLSLKWGVKPEVGNNGAEFYELYAIKVTERNGKPALSGDVVVDAEDTFEPTTNRPCVSMRMNSEGARLWAMLTEQNIGKAVAIVLDDKVYSAPNVQNKITGGVSQITGNFTLEDTRDLASVLKSGKMAAPVKIVSSEFVGPTLGQESINQGMWSFILAFILLMIYMCVMYGFIPGMVANGALLLNFFFTLGTLASFQAALTMSGIAGMVLSLGMAVDANVLIYERTKEELRAGKKVAAALDSGYSNAFSAIFDSNLTSLITAVILFNFGTGPVRGFATTLMIGICVSFFTAVYVTRLVYDNRMKKDKWQGLTFTTSLSRKFLSDTHYRFMRTYKKSFAIFAMLLVVGLGAWAVRGLSQGIDFTGGRTYVLQFEQEVQPEQVRSLLANTLGDANLQVIAQGADGKVVRITTNYRVEEDGTEVDMEIENVLFKALQEGNLLSQDLTIELFKDYDNREGGSIISSQKVGPSVAAEITEGAVKSVIFALFAIFIYILIRFHKVAFSIGAIIALIVDTLLIIGMYALCWGWLPISLEIDQTFIGAVLTAIGYSINDKVVVFDRIREFLRLHPKRDLQQLFNDSLNTTLTRTINTSVSTLVVLLCIFFLGGDSIRSFAFAMILGVVFGTLSSIFIAAPVAYLTMGRKIKDSADEPQA